MPSDCPQFFPVNSNHAISDARTSPPHIADNNMTDHERPTLIQNGSRIQT